MKRSRQEREQNRRLGPAAAAMRRNRHNVFRDARESDSQVTVEKLLRDAVAMQKFHTPSGKGARARLLIYSPEELAMYRKKQRAEMDEKVKRGYKFLGNWIRYARWEAQQKDFARMRAVLQRAVGFHGDDAALWRDYAELEAANGFVAEARAVWSRGVTALPASTDLWLKYLIFEQAAAAGGGGGGGSSSTTTTTTTTTAAAVGSSSSTPISAAASTALTLSATSSESGVAAVRDVFNRWLAVPTAVPPVAFELYALFEAQRGERERCRAVLRQYLEHANSPAAWVFVGRAEWEVFGDADRAVRVLTTALEALPPELLWGPVECRVPLALADALAAVGRIDEARRQYRALLEKVSSSGGASLALVDDVLAAYGRFERLHADGGGGAADALSRLEARKTYERRLHHDATDFDAWLSFYVLCRGEADGGGGADDILARALAAPAQALAHNPHAAQQRAVLVVEYARRCEARGEVAAARAALTEGIRQFPFETARCPRLWMEAAAFEERQGELATARTLLSAGAKVSQTESTTPTTSDGGSSSSSRSSGAAAAASGKMLFRASLRLEEQALQRGAATAAEYVDRVRTLYRDAIRFAPLDDALWLGLGRLEEKEGQPARAQAIYVAAIRTLTAEASATQSYTQRYVLLSRVDALWGRRLALQHRTVKRLRRGKAAGAAGETAEEAEKALDELYVALLTAVWEDYTFEGLAWRSSAAAAAPPAALPAALEPPQARWAEAADAVIAHFLSRGGDGAASGPPAVRAVFTALMEAQKAVLRRTVGLTDETPFDAAQTLSAWVALLMSPLTKKWAAFEATHRGSLEAVQEHAPQPQKRRTRLLRNRK